METRKDTAIYKACEFISKQVPGTLLKSTEPIDGVKRGTWGVMLCQLEVVGVVKSTGWHKPYVVTADAAIEPAAMVELWREASRQPKTTHRKKNRSSKEQQPVEPPPPPEEVEIDPIEFLRKLLQTGSLDMLLTAAKLEYGAPAEDQGRIAKLEEQIVQLERAESAHHKQNVDLHEANRRLREELFNERRRIQDLRAQLQTASGQTKVIEKIIKVGVVPPGGQSSGGSMGFKYPRTHGQHMSKGGRPVGTSGGGVVAVYRKKKPK